MGSWGDDVDYEAKELKDVKGRFTINFKKIYMDVSDINEKTLEITDKHPKDALLLSWAGIMVGLLIFMVFSYKIFAFITLPIMAFYVVALFRVAGSWKHFHYSPVKFWLMTAGALVVCAGLAVGAHYLFEFMQR